MKRPLLAMLLVIQAGLCFSEKVMTGLYILNLGKFDISDGSFSVDCFISFKDKESKNILPELKYEFMNGSTDSIYYSEDSEYSRLIRAKASLAVPVDLKDFPFEKHRIQILFEDQELEKEKLTYVPDLDISGIDPAVFIPGYSIDNWYIEILDHEYQVFNETYSQFVFTIEISKPIWNAFQKTLLPVFIMVMMVLLSFLFKKEMFENRIAAISSGLLGVVMFHSSLSSQLPPIGYLTFADKIMVISYGIIMVCLLVNLIIARHMNIGNHTIAEAIDKKVKYNVIIIYIIIFAIYCLVSINR